MENNENNFDNLKESLVEEDEIFPNNNFQEKLMNFK